MTAKMRVPVKCVFGPCQVREVCVSYFRMVERRVPALFCVKSWREVCKRLVWPCDEWTMSLEVCGV